MSEEKTEWTVAEYEGKEMRRWCVCDKDGPLGLPWVYDKSKYVLKDGEHLEAQILMRRPVKRDKERDDE